MNGTGFLEALGGNVHARALSFFLEKRCLYARVE